VPIQSAHFRSLSRCRLVCGLAGGGTLTDNTEHAQAFPRSTFSTLFASDSSDAGSVATCCCSCRAVNAYVAVYCDRPHGDKRLDASPAECLEAKVPVHTECQLSCLGDGFRLVGNDTRTCRYLDDGVTAWLPAEWPSCVGKLDRLLDVLTYSDAKSRDNRICGECSNN